MSLERKVGASPQSPMPSLFLALFCRQMRSSHDLSNSLLSVLILLPGFHLYFSPLYPMKRFSTLVLTSCVGCNETLYYIEKEIGLVVV